MIKVFRINDYDCVAAETIQEAKQYGSECADYVDVAAAEADSWFEDCRELTEEEMNTFKFIGEEFEDEDGTEKKDADVTFKDHLKELVDSKEQFPCMFASTEY